MHMPQDTIHIRKYYSICGGLKGTNKRNRNQEYLLNHRRCYLMIIIYRSTFGLDNNSNFKSHTHKYVTHIEY